MKKNNYLFSHLFFLMLPLLGSATLVETPPESLCTQIAFKNEFELPEKFRRTDQHSLPEDISKGLEKLNASASRQFSEGNLKCLIKDLGRDNILIIDLRRECHGFQDGAAVAWISTKPVNDEKYEYNHDLSSKEIEDKEGTLLTHFKNSVHEDKTMLTERQLTEQLGVNYLRIPVMDHQIPTDEQVDLFVSLINSRSSETWLHFHCAGGMGRTTTFMSMLDMMHNAADFSAYEIMQRQEALNGSNVWNPRAYEGQHPSKIVRAFERVKLLCLFHHYCLENPTFSISWSEWLSQQTFKRS